MSKYLLIESRDPFEAADVRYFYDLATQLAGQGHDVALYLVQNGVLAVRKEALNNPLRKVVEEKVKVLLDDFSLRERGIKDDERIAGTTLASVSSLVDLLAEEGRKALWH